jgi:hypothetical protein
VDNSLLDRLIEVYDVGPPEAPTEPPQSERREAGIKWLSDPENLDAEGWGPLDRFTEVVGGPETVEVMLREGLIEVHPSQLNRVRLIRP